MATSCQAAEPVAAISDSCAKQKLELPEKSVLSTEKQDNTSESARGCEKSRKKFALNKRAKSNKRVASNKKEKIESEERNVAVTKPKSLVDELKLFQNNNLLNQQDPLEQLHFQLNQLNKDDSHQRPSMNLSPALVQLKDGASNRLSLLQSPSQSHQQQERKNGEQNLVPMLDRINVGRDNFSDSCENNLTIKKGVLWQQQYYDKIHKRLFNRWKKRYFILTTDYLVCFKRSSSRVGHSEMGEFLYKTLLNDITQTDWLRPQKSDKGAIILHIKGQFDLYLWSKINLEEWMFMIQESIERHKFRRSCIAQNISRQTHNIRGDNIGVDFQDKKDSSHPPIKRSEQNHESSIQMSSIGNESPKISEGAGNYQTNSQQIPKNRLIRSETITKYTASDTNLSSESRSQPTHSLARGSEGSVELVGNSNLSNSDSRSGDAKLRKNSSSLASRLSQGKEIDSMKLERKLKDVDDNDQSHTGRQSSLESEKNEISLDEAEQNMAETQMIYDPSGNGLGERRSSDEVERAKQADDPQIPSRGDARSSQRSSASRGLLEAEVDPSPSLAGSATNGTTVSKQPGETHTTGPQENSPVVSKDGRPAAAKRKSKPSKKLRASDDNPISTDNGVENQARVDDTEVSSRSGCFESQNTRGRSPPQPPSPPRNRATANLIRRDDSWQSLVSLTRIGMTNPVNVHVPQRSLYAQHIMPEDNVNCHSSKRQHIISQIESTMTPLRLPLSRKQSIQSASQRRLRALPLNSQHADSLDVAPSSPLQIAVASHQKQQRQNSISYQNKLLQLQLMHNSNNVDYIRHNGNGSDYQIYGAESTTTNPYGYSSMRSNLKSAASEFSFIRPASSSNQHMSQSTLPHHYQGPSSRSFLIDKSSSQLQQSINRPVMAPTDPASFLAQQSDSNNNVLNSTGTPTGQAQQQQQYLINPTSGERIGLQQLVGLERMNYYPKGVAEFNPIMRDLPLKPNKNGPPLKDNNDSNSLSLTKGSSLTSSIACFFRRAFSRRSKKGPQRRSKLTEGCSKSLGTFDDGFIALASTPSAFSTGNKSCNDQNSEQTFQQQQQSQRMVDMIEAFTNKTFGEEAALRHELTRIDRPHQLSALSPNLEQSVFKVTPRRLPAYNFGSPLHKSNSISTTMGFNVADMKLRQGSYSRDNEMVDVAGSSILRRSTKVMSANLTPTFLHRGDPTLCESSSGQQQQFVHSPRAASRRDILPRPSSIYGQPSMISSPIISREGQNNFGMHRSSFHNSNLRDRGSNAGLESRRYPMMRTPFLDPTREVAEDVPSPTNDHGGQGHLNSSDNFDHHPNSRYPNELNISKQVPASHHARESRQQKAIVTPILQSPTMNTIYDNHPMVNDESLPSYSHYDNYNHLLASDRSQQSPFIYRPRVSGSITTQFQAKESTTHVPDDNPSGRSNSDYVSRLVQSNNLSRQIVSREDIHQLDHSQVVVGMNKKPAAIVAPSTPMHNSFSENFRNDPRSPSIDLNYRNHRQQYSSILESRSPAATRRSVGGGHTMSSPYKQSPLVNHQTRPVNTNQMIQTIIGDHDSQIMKPIINSASASKIRLDSAPSGSMRGEAIVEGFSSPHSTKGLATRVGSKYTDSRPFSISTRLSKTKDNLNRSSTNENSSSLHIPDKKGGDAIKEIECNNNSIQGSKNHELSSSCIPSKISGHQGSRDLNLRKFVDLDGQTESSGIDTNKTTNLSHSRPKNRLSKRRGLRELRRVGQEASSSREALNEISSNNVSLDGSEDTVLSYLPG